jgi:hypothetical protein
MSIQDYITQSAKDQRDLLMTITDARFSLDFDFGVGYIAVARNFVDGIDFCLNEGETEGKYVAYLVDHNIEQFLDFSVEDLEPTRESVTHATERAYEYLRNR